MDPPAAKKDEFGNLVTDREELEDLYIPTYQNRLQPNPISDKYVELKNLKEYLFNIELKLSKSQISKSWSIEDLSKALKSFKNNKARDEHGHIYELFKYGGSSIKLSLLKLFNLVKQMQFNFTLPYSNIPTVPVFGREKGRGPILRMIVAFSM